jgi:hypothetical protein
MRCVRCRSCLTQEARGARLDVLITDGNEEVVECLLVRASECKGREGM